MSLSFKKFLTHITAFTRAYNYKTVAKIWEASHNLCDVERYPTVGWTYQHSLANTRGKQRAGTRANL